MRYLPELYYFYDKDFPSEKAILMTAKKIGEWSVYYKARLISPKKGIKDIEKQGKLPLSPKEKQQFIEDLIKWIFSNSYTSALFMLFLDDSEINHHNEEYPKFDHHDDTCCWTLNLTQDEFNELKNQWKRENLPEDLFFESGQEKQIKPKFIGFSKTYTPKQWEKENNKQKS